MNTSMNKKILEHQYDLAVAVGDFMKYWGFKSIHGRIWCLLYLSNAPKEAQFLIDTLNVSKGLVSLAIKDLLQYKVICRAETDPPCQLQYYNTSPDILNVITHVLQTREMKMLDKVNEITEKFEILINDEKSKCTEINCEKLRSIKDITCLANYTLKNICDDIQSVEVFSKS